MPNDENESANSEAEEAHIVQEKNNNESLHHENVDDGENDDEEASDLEISDND